MNRIATFLAAAILPVIVASGAQAGVNIGAADVLTLAKDNAAIENVQFVVSGQSYCWYDNGWRGPGWYWCGYAWRSGYGWGGVAGWNGWVWRGGGAYWRGGRYYGGGWRGGGVAWRGPHGGGVAWRGPRGGGVAWRGHGGFRRRR